MGRIIKHFKFNTDFFGSGYEHNLYDVDVEDVELSQSKVAGDRFWKLTVRGKEYDVAPDSETLIESARKSVIGILEDIRIQIDSAQPDSPKKGNSK